MIKIGKRIKELREQAEISQQKLAELLKLSRPAISQIENNDRKLSAEELIKLSEIFNLSVEGLLNRTKQPRVVLKEDKKAVNPVRKKLSNGVKVRPQIRINVPQRNIEKFKEVLLYILNKVGSKPNIGETVIYKLLYFIDFNFYEKYEEQLIGATYIKNHYGPTPIEFKKIVAKLTDNKEIISVATDYFKYPQTKYLPLKKPDLSKLKANEIEIIDEVLSRLSDMNASQISDYSHNDVPWLTTESGKVIEYESVFYRTPPYSLREYNEDVS